MSVEENKKIAAKYHNLNPSDVDEILAPDFKGQHGPNGFSWNRESHGKYLTDNKGKMKDVIHEQFGEGDHVCSRLTRSGTSNDGTSYVLEGMHIKTFRDGKIVHIWEYRSQENSN